jgi:hypothetical protein
MNEIKLSETDLEKLASQALGVPRNIDLGPAPSGGRYYQNISEGLAVALDKEDLQEAVEDAVRFFFQERRKELRSSLAACVREERKATREIDREAASAQPAAAPLLRTR